MSKLFRIRMMGGDCLEGHTMYRDQQERMIFNYALEAEQGILRMYT